MFRAVPRFAQIAAIILLAAVSRLAALTMPTHIAPAVSGGSGSRGARTFDTPAITRTAPTQAAPVE